MAKHQCTWETSWKKERFWLSFTGLEGKFLYEFSLVASTVLSVWFLFSNVLWMMMKFAIIIKSMETIQSFGANSYFSFLCLVCVCGGDGQTQFWFLLDKCVWASCWWGSLQEERCEEQNTDFNLGSVDTLDSLLCGVFMIESDPACRFNRNIGPSVPIICFSPSPCFIYVLIHGPLGNSWVRKYLGDLSVALTLFC